MNCTNEYITVNGTRQSIMTMSTDFGNPVLLIVHGGAGCPDRPLVMKYNSELADYYTVVCWDQRGSGFSYMRGPLTIDILLSDLKEVVDYLRKKYRQDKIYIAGHSWGSYLGIRFADMHRNAVKYYIGTGQEVSAVESEPDKYAFVKEQAEKRNEKSVIRRLEFFGEPQGYSYKRSDALAKKYVYRLLVKYSGYFSRSGPSLGSYLLLYLRLYGKCYKTDTVKLLMGIAKALITLNAEMYQKDSISCINDVDFPVLLISGEEDMICPVPTARRWLDKLNAPKKDYALIKNAAHMVNFEQPREWNRLLIDLLSDNVG